MTELGTLFEGLRVSDVRDGMDWAGLHSKGTVSGDIGPLYQGARLCGPAHTIRHRLSEKAVPSLSPDEYTTWAYSYWYKELYSYPLEKNLKTGEVVVVESPPDVAVGEIGSNNSLAWYAAGAAGIISSGGVRDRDECIQQQVPIFCRHRAQSMVQGRVEFDSAQIPVSIGGALIRPGDIVVADGDGVIAVPAEHAETVAKYARQELEKDKVGRRKLYEKLGWPLDETVQ